MIYCYNYIYALLHLEEMSVIHFKPFKRQSLTSMIKLSEEKVSALFSKYQFDIFDFFILILFTVSVLLFDVLL